MNRERKIKGNQTITSQASKPKRKQPENLNVSILPVIGNIHKTIFNTPSLSAGAGGGSTRQSTTRLTSSGSRPPSTLKSGWPVARSVGPPAPAPVAEAWPGSLVAGNSERKDCFSSWISLASELLAANLLSRCSGQTGPERVQLSNTRPSTFQSAAASERGLCFGGTMTNHPNA